VVDLTDGVATDRGAVIGRRLAAAICRVCSHAARKRRVAAVTTAAATTHVVGNPAAAAAPV